jgi:aspartate racemase
MADWSQYPMNKDVHWPKNEKIVGVLGVAPIATMDFYAKLVLRPIQKDWQMPRIIMDVNSKIPSRGRYFELGEADFAPYIKDGIIGLYKSGADFVVIPCNAAHIVYERFAQDSPIPIPHIVDITCVAAKKAGIKQPVALYSSYARKFQLYKKTFQQVVDFPEQSIVSAGIEAVKKNVNTNGIARQILDIISTMKNVDGIIYGCTEVGLLMQSVQIQLPVIDSNKALADFCFEFSNSDLSENIRLRA